MMKTMKVAYGVPRGDEHHAIRDYKVLVVKNSVEYSPGDVLSIKEVDALCADKKWDITVVSLKTEGQFRPNGGE